MMRRIFFTRYDWMQDAAASFMDGFGVWATPRENMLDSRPQVAAVAVDNRDPASTQFAVDLGAQHRVGMIAFAGLRATSMGLMQAQAGIDPTFAENLYDTGIITPWPLDSTAGEFDAWGRWTLNGCYQSDEYFALGMPRILIPPAPIWIRYIRVAIRDPLARDPLSIGSFGVYDVWEPPFNLGYGWTLTLADESVASRVPGGSTYIDLRGVPRRLSLGFPSLPDDEIWARGFGLMLAKGKSVPLWVVPFTDAGEITRYEKAAVYGLVSQDSALSNPYSQRYALPVQIDQLY